MASWGGFRANAGRKNAKNGEKKRVHLSTTVEPSTKAFLQGLLRRSGLNQGEAVDLLLQLAQESPRFAETFPDRLKEWRQLD